MLAVVQVVVDSSVWSLLMLMLFALFSALLLLLGLHGSVRRAPTRALLFFAAAVVVVGAQETLQPDAAVAGLGIHLRNGFLALYLVWLCCPVDGCQPSSCNLLEFFGCQR